jgi:hypothetical protein
MKNYNKFVFSAALAATLVIAAAPVRAQLDTASPIIVRQTPPKRMWLNAEVVRADRNSIVVREQSNSRAIHTFSYAPELRTSMEQIEDQGAGFQSGDAVKILYLEGETVALKIRGKPSKPS